MKHYKGETIKVYDGDFIGWTTAELIEFAGECGGYERWRMITKEGSELMRLVGFDERHREKPVEKPAEFFKPVLFKRLRRSDWEEGMLIMNDNGEFVVDKGSAVVKQVYKHKSNWF